MKVLLQRFHLNGSTIGFYPKTSKLDRALINFLKVGAYVLTGTPKENPPTPLARGSPPLISLNRKDIMRKASFYSCNSSVGFSVLIHFLLYLCFEEAAWPSGHGAGLAIRRPQVQVPPWLLAGFVLGSSESKSLTTLLNSRLVCLRPVWIVNHVMFALNYLFEEFARPH